MASIEYRRTSSGDRWRVVWRQDGTKQQQTYENQPAAVAFKLRVEAYGNAWPPGEDPRVERATGRLTFGDWAIRAVESRTQANERTKADYRRDIERHLADLSPIPLADLNSEHVAAWVKKLRKTPTKPEGTELLSDKTIRNLHGFASSLMLDALKQHPPLAAHNPFAAGLEKRSAVHTEEMVFLTPQEFGTVLGHVRPEYADLTHTLYMTGARYGELTAVQVRDVALLGNRQTMTITKAWKRLGTSGYVIGEPKTPKSRRTISLSPLLVDLLAPLTVGRRGTDLLFPGPANGRLPHSEVYKRAWAPAVARSCVCDAHYEPQRTNRQLRYPGERPRLPKPCDCLGVFDKRPRIHDLRHSHASNLISEGMSLVEISRRLGHSSIQITIDRYGHLDPSADEAMNAAIDRVMTRI